MFGKTWILSTSSLLVILNCIYFYLTGFNHSDVEWTSYLFIHLAYVLMIVMPYFTPKTNNSLIFSYNRSTIAFLYVFVALIVGIASTMLFNTLTVPMVTQTIVALIFVWTIIYVISTDHLIAKSQESRKIDRQIINYLMHEVEMLMLQTNDITLKKATEHLYDAIKSAQVRSNQNVSYLEMDLIKNLNDLKKIHSSNDEKVYNLMTQMENIIHERNLLLRHGNED